MIVTFSSAAEMVLSRTKDFRKALLAAVEGVGPGQCFIDGRIGRTPANDELVLMCQGHDPITVPHNEFGDADTLPRIVKEWSKPSE